MDNQTRQHFANLTSSEDQTRLKALKSVLNLTEKKVPWIYEVWDELVRRLDDPNSYQRSISIMVLCNLAKSDPEKRLSTIVDSILKHTNDEKFITSRQCIQSLWKVAIVNQACRGKILKHLEKRFKECVKEKHYNLIRQDIIQTLGRLSADSGLDGTRELAHRLIGVEQDGKYRKKYETVLAGSVRTA